MPLGTVIVIGGAEDKVRDRVILSRFVALAGGRTRTIAVISTASLARPRGGRALPPVFMELGAAEVRPLHAITRPQANDEACGPGRARRDRRIFLTGGNQLRLSSTIGGTRLADAILERFQDGRGGRRHVAPAQRDVEPHDRVRGVGRDAQAADGPDRGGLGLLPGVIIDQHFQQRNRLGRLLSLIAQNPSLLGLGVDEDTAGVVGPDHVMEVIGRGCDHRRRRRAPRRPTPGRSAATGRS